MKCKQQNKIVDDNVVTNGIHKNTYELLFEDKDNLSEEEKLTPQQRHTINEMSALLDNIELLDLLPDLLKPYVLFKDEL